MPQLSPYFTCSRAYLIGIQNYQHLPTLSTPIKDVDDLANCLFQHEFLEENVNVSINSSAADIENVVAQMLRESEPRDRVILYFAGHGIAREESDEPGGFLVPVNAEKNVPESFIEMRWLLQQLVKLKCKHFLLILDCCFAGAIRKAEPYRTLAFDLTKKLYREKFDRYVDDGSMVRQVLTSSSNEEALDKLLNIGTRDGEGSNSPFAYALLKLLNGRIESPHHFEDGIITTTRMYDHIDQALEKLRKDHQLKKMQSPYYFPLRDNIRGQFIFLLPEKGETVIEKLPHREIKNPYKGLSSFETKDSHLFFGRKQALKELCALYKLNKVLLISGASGVGKSSLIQAGFIPAVSVEAFTLRPGNIRGIKDYLETRAAKIKTAKGEFLLFADQFEEMVTICTEAERMDIDKFILANLENPLCKVIISTRSDFESQLKDKTLIKSTQYSRFVVPPFSRDEIEDIIVQPAYQAVIQIESDENTEEENHKFIDKIVDEVMQSPGSLPLLSFALQEWYIQSVREEDNAWVLKESYYKGIGGVSGALSTIIEKFSDSLETGMEMECLKKLLLRMVSVRDGQPARKKIYADELQFDSTEQTAVIQELLHKLIELRIISTNPPNGNGQQQKTYYEPVHDSLLTSWGQLWEWINAEGMGKMAAYQQLTEDTKQWENATSNKRDILWGERLELKVLVEDLGGKSTVGFLYHTLITTLTLGYLPVIKASGHHIFNRNEDDFIRHSGRKVNWIKSRLNLIILVLSISLVGAVTLWIESSKNQKKHKAYAHTTIADNIKEKDNMQALRIMQKAFSLTPSDSILEQKMQEIWKSRGYHPFYMGPYHLGTEIQGGELSPTGRYMVFTEDTLIVFDLDSSKIINQLEKREYGTVAYSPVNDSILISYNYSGQIIVWNFIRDTVLFRRNISNFKSISLKGDHALIDMESAIIVIQLSDPRPKTFYRPLIKETEATNTFTSGWLEDDRIYYTDNNWVYIQHVKFPGRDSIKREGNVTWVAAKNDHVVISSDIHTRLFNSKGEFLKQLLKDPALGHTIKAIFSPDGERILLSSWEEYSNFKASLWKANGDFIKTYDHYPAAEFSTTGQYVVLHKWIKTTASPAQLEARRLKGWNIHSGLNYYIRSEKIERLDSTLEGSYNGFLLSKNDQFLVSFPNLEMMDLNTKKKIVLPIKKYLKIDTIEEYSENYGAEKDGKIRTGQVVSWITSDSKYLVTIAPLIKKKNAPDYKMYIYNFSTGKYIEIPGGKELKEAGYIPGYEFCFLLNENSFQYWDINYLMNTPNILNITNVPDILRYLDTSKLFPPLDRKYDKF